MAIYQGDIGIHDIKLGSIDVFEIYQGSKLVYPENTEITITFKLNVSGIVTINGYTPVISENNTKFVFTIPVKTNYTAIIEADHYQSQTITGNSGYLPITHNVELVWNTEYVSYTVTFPTDGVKVLFDGVEKGVITNGKLVVQIDDTVAKDSYTVTFSGSKASTYNTSGLKVVDSSIAATGGSYDLKLSTSFVKTAYTRTDYASSTGSITKGSTYAGSWIETVINLTASFTSSTTLGSINNNVLTIANNESTNTKSGTLTVIFTLENKQTKEVSAALNQAAGAKVYTNWVLDLQTDGTSVEAKGGTRTVTANIARRTYKWNNTGTVYSETATPTLSISGSASLSGNQIKFTSNESVSARSATLTASYVGLSKTITITQQAGAKVYSAWSAWAVSISASTQTIGASGGSSTITTNASRSRTWTWNGVGTTHTDTETGTPTLSGTATGFTLSGTTVTASNNESTNSRSINITATHSGVTKSITISQSAGSKVYGSWSKWTINKSSSGTTIAASGGSGTVSAPTAIRTRSYTWNGTGTSYTEQGTGTPTLTKQSGDGSFSVSGTTATVSYGNNTTTSSKSTVVRATMDTEYVDTTFTQSAGSKVYGSWSIWSVYCNASSFTVSASGGSVTIYSGASRSRSWTWNGVSGSGGTEKESGTPTLSASGSGSLSGTTLSYGNNTSTSSRTTRVTASYGGSSNYCDITQSAGSKTYSSWGAWNITLTANPTTIAAAGGNSTLSTSATRSRTWQWNGTGTTYTEQGSGTPTLSKVSGAATLNSKTVNYGNNTSTNSRSSVFRATIDSATKDITITQSAGSKVYGSWSIWSVYCNASSFTVSASGGSVTIYSGASRSRSWTWNGVSGSGGTEKESGTPTLSASGSGSLSGTTLSYGNNTSTSSRTTRVTASYGGSSNYCDITQSAGSKTYSSWGAWNITLTANPTTIAAAGGNSTLSTSATRSRTWQWNGTGTTYTEQGSGTPTLSKVSGAATLNSKTVNYGNNTSTNSRSSVFRATIDSATKDITITQSAGSLVYQNVIYHTTYYGTGPDTGIDSTTYPNVCEIDKDISSKGELIYVYYKIYTTQKYTWNGVEGSGGTTYKYYTASDIVAISKVNCDVLVGNASTVGDNMIAFGIQVLSNSSTSSRTWYVKWRWLGSQNNTTRGTQQGSPVVGRFCIQNNNFTTTNVTLPVYINGMNVDSIYDGETTYNNIISSPVIVYVYIPTNVSTFYSGKLQFWFEHADGGGDKYNCSLSNYSAAGGIIINNNGTIISVNSNTTISGFTILCQFTMTSNKIVFNVRVLAEA